MTDKFYLDTIANKLHGYPADCSLDHIIPSTFTSLTANQVEAFLNPPLTLAQVQTAQLATLTSAYKAACQQPVSYLNTTFQADSNSQDTLNKVLVSDNGSIPAGFYWVDANNNQISMNFVQLQGLAMAMLTQGWTSFQHLQTQKAAVRAATTIQQVQEIAW